MADAKLPKTLELRGQDPLYSIFEDHLYNFQDCNIDRKTFIVQVVQDYLTYLRKLKISIPKSMEGHIVEELGVLVNTMLVKKIYGCVDIAEFREKQPGVPNHKTRSKYSRLRTGSE